MSQLYKGVCPAQRRYVIYNTALPAVLHVQLLLLLCVRISKCVCLENHLQASMSLRDKLLLTLFILEKVCV